MNYRVAVLARSHRDAKPYLRRGKNYYYVDSVRSAQGLRPDIVLEIDGWHSGSFNDSSQCYDLLARWEAYTVTAPVDPNPPTVGVVTHYSGVFACVGAPGKSWIDWTNSGWTNNRIFPEKLLIVLPVPVRGRLALMKVLPSILAKYPYADIETLPSQPAHHPSSQELRGASAVLRVDTLGGE